QQKMFLLVGPKRGGKGTIARVLIQMIGRHNVAGPTLASLGANFGLQDLIGKPVAIISDARIGSRADASLIAERLTYPANEMIACDNGLVHWPTRTRGSHCWNAQQADSGHARRDHLDR